MNATQVSVINLLKFRGKKRKESVDVVTVMKIVVCV